MVSFGYGMTGYYAHAKLLGGIKVGDFVPRGKAFASVENPGLGQFHAHMCLLVSDNVSVDPYDYSTESRVPHYAK